MGWTQPIEYIDEEVALPKPVKKQVWDGEQFVEMTLYRMFGLMRHEQREWLNQNFGPAGTYVSGQYWDQSRGGSFVVMDAKVYTWFCLKWSNK